MEPTTSDGLTVGRVAEIVDDPRSDRHLHLRRQKQMVEERIARLRHVVAALQREMEAEQMDIKLTPEERFEIFGDHVPEDHAEEAAERWGGTDAYKESQKRVSGYRKKQWTEIKAEAANIEERFAQAMASGAPPASPVAMDLAEEHRRHISRWFYECSPDIHLSLGQMYVADPRFKAHYDRRAEGLAAYVSAAIEANHDRERA